MRKLLLALALTVSFQSLADDSELVCLAKNIQAEAGGESRIGKLAVAQVTLNRVRHKAYPNNVCDVVFQPKQFSWTHTKPNVKYTKESMLVAKIALSGKHQLSNFKATNFHTLQVKPKWSSKLKRAGVIGNHVFYYHEKAKN